MSIVQKYMESLSNCLDELLGQDIEGVVDLILNAHKRGKRVFIMGNGGSATTASHLARDLAIGASVEAQPRLRAVSLTDSIALITSLSSDIDYSCIFKEQLIGQLDEGDVVIAISASGSSPNVVRAIEFARSKDAITIGFLASAVAN